jgi:hypothetical protein
MKAIFVFSILTLPVFATQISFIAPNDFGINDKIKDLSSVVGPSWREVAEKNRTLNLHKLHGEDLTFALHDISLKYAGTNSLDTSNVPLNELNEIVEASFRGGINTEAYAWALLRNFLTSDKKVSDPTTASKILSCIDKNLAGVTPKDNKGDVISFDPYWRITSFRSGSYKTVLPCDGFFESKWSYSLGECSYDLRTSAKRIDCHIGIALFMKVYNVTVNGKDVDFNSTKFTAIPDKDGVAKIKIIYSWTGKKKQKVKQ